jgi:hypothetical protein
VRTDSIVGSSDSDRSDDVRASDVVSARVFKDRAVRRTRGAASSGAQEASGPAPAHIWEAKFVDQNYGFRPGEVDPMVRTTDGGG